MTRWGKGVVKGSSKVSRDPVVKPGGKRPTAKGSMGQSVKGGFGKNKQGSCTGVAKHSQKGLF